eukprot:CAMPEP_0196720526 /NCGR_PEP_ID=MMETSP1091-20130531/3309_1 /TAXON_ID=302021 /ORGANISM="Rhodomonas sp., Strain CCMP768" /LENGTH=475 /DNA_ID=CAMNT_0042061797 /DNA_START=56 /DNA_END=1483 /DNA_ORIENTATION=-
MSFSWLKLCGLVFAFALIVPSIVAEEDSSDEEASDSDFSFSALFIGFREALEACVIISVMLNMLDKTGNKPLKKWVWIGSLGGLLVSCIIGGAMVGAYYALKDNVMSDNDMYIFEGVFSGIASIFLTFLGIGFLRFAELEGKWSEKLFKQSGQPQAEPRTWKEKLKAKYGIQSQAIDERQLVAGQNFGNGTVEDTSSSDSNDADETREVNHWTIVVLCFSAVFREGLETFLFLGAVGSNAKPSGLALGGLVGVVLGVLFGVAVLYIGKVIDNLMWFFMLTTVFILFIAAGLAGYSAHEFEELGVTHAFKTNDPIIMRPLWDISDCCSDSKGPGAVFRAIAGYQDKPTMVEALVYLGYWIIVLSMLVLRYKAGILFRKRRAAGGASPTADSSAPKERAIELEAGKGENNADVVYPTQVATSYSAQPFMYGNPMPQYGTGYPGMPSMSPMMQPMMQPMQPVAGHQAFQYPLMMSGQA